MLSRIKIENFKTIRTGTVANLTNINIIIGKNNRGKSAFIEALYLLNSNREDKLIPSFNQAQMFWRYNVNSRIKYEIGYNGYEQEVLYNKGAVLYDISK